MPAAAAALFECVPNFSEGRDPEVLASLEQAITGVAGAALLDRHADWFHHRSVFTFAGAPEPVAEAAFRAVRVARDRIDLTRHRGEHPRIGAADVVPLVPLAGADLDACVPVARELGRRIAEELDIPVYLYGRAAATPGRRSLSDVRRGEFEGLRETIGLDPERGPDFGPARVHPTAGATAVGVRPILVAYNVLLDTPDVGVARDIARGIRASQGGLPAVRALGLLVDGRAQISTNLEDIDVTPPARVFGAVAEAAGRRGIRVLRSELVGLCPERAVSPEDAERIRLDDALEAHLLEPKLRRALPTAH